MSLISKETSIYKGVKEIRDNLVLLIPNNLQISDIVNVDHEKGKEEEVASNWWIKTIKSLQNEPTMQVQDIPEAGGTTAALEKIRKEEIIRAATRQQAQAETKLREDLNKVHGYILSKLDETMRTELNRNDEMKETMSMSQPIKLIKTLMIIYEIWCGSNSSNRINQSLIARNKINNWKIDTTKNANDNMTDLHNLYVDYKDLEENVVDKLIIYHQFITEMNNNRDTNSYWSDLKRFYDMVQIDDATPKLNDWDKLWSKIKSWSSVITFISTTPEEPTSQPLLEEEDVSQKNMLVNAVAMIENFVKENKYKRPIRGGGRSDRTKNKSRHDCPHCRKTEVTHDPHNCNANPKSPNFMPNRSWSNNSDPNKHGRKRGRDE